MTRTELAAALALALFAAFCVGWLACWAAGRFTRAATSDLTALDRLAQSLHEAEEARDEARARSEALEAERGAIVSAFKQVEAEAEGLRAWIERHHAGGR